MGGRPAFLFGPIRPAVGSTTFKGGSTFAQKIHVPDMKKSALGAPPMYFERYTNLVADDLELDSAFAQSLDEISLFDWEKCRRLGSRSYAPGKWPVAEVLQHLLDWERIMSYRALFFARKGPRKPQGIDVDSFAANSLGAARSIDSLVEEMTVTRQATRLFFKNMTDEQLLRQGTNWQTRMSVAAMGFTIIGHQRHHFGMIEELYFPLV